MPTFDYRKLLSNAAFQLLLAGPFLAIVVSCGFMVDDWGQLGGRDTYWSQVGHWKELWAYRPISWLALPALVHLFRDSYVLLATFHLVVLSLAFIEISSWRVANLSSIQRRFALTLMFAPAISSTTVFSVVNQLTASISLLLFAIGLRVDRKSQLLTARIVTAFFFAASLLTYEVTLPVIIVHFAFQIYESSRKLRSIFIPAGVFISAISWQKLIAPVLLDTNYSRLSSLSPVALLTFFYSIFISAPVNLITTAFRALPLVLIILVLYWICLVRIVSKSETIESSRGSVSSYFLFVGTLSSGLLFFLSGAAAQVNGYPNRGMIGTWLLASLFLARLLSTERIKVAFLLLCIAASNFVLFTDKVWEASRATHLRKQVVEEISASSVTQSANRISLILDIPCYQEDFRFDTSIFCTSWDARGALSAHGMNFVSVDVVQDSGFIRPEFPPVLASDLRVVVFNQEFRIVRIDSVPGVDQGRLIEQLQLKGAKENEQLDVFQCKKEFLNVFRLETFLRLGKVVRCLQDPF